MSLLLCPLLGGCVDYALDIRFDSQTHGQITQILHLSDRLLTLDDTVSETLFQAIAAKANALSGKATRLNADTLKVTLPFNNGAQLVERFNAFYNSANYNSAEMTDAISVGNGDDSLFGRLPGAPNVSSHLDLQQRNYLFALRNRLTYRLQLDERAARAADTRLNDLSWLNLDFSLTTPWNLRAAAPTAQAAALSPVSQPFISGHTATWHLAANQPQVIEAIFWVPSPIGLGAGAIALFCSLGYLVKYKLIARNQ
ncbi:MAG: DUF3153 domain-containing protein [Phormidesmis sp.]